MKPEQSAAPGRSWLRFVFGGALNTALSYALYLLLHLLMPYQVAYGLAYAAGIVFAYWFNARYVFRVPLSWRGLFAYPLVYAVQYLASAAILEILVAGWGVAKAFAPLLVSAVMLPLTFVMSRWVLRWTGRSAN